MLSPDPPVVSISEIQPAAIGSNITLICNITSLTEEIDVTWFKNRVILNKSQTDTSQSIGGSVFLHTLTLNFLGVDNGGNYSCKATNKAGDGWSELVHLSLFESKFVNLSLIIWADKAWCREQGFVAHINVQCVLLHVI